ncbi:MAG: SA1362 family protein [Heyndrickxia sp.]
MHVKNILIGVIFLLAVIGFGALIFTNPASLFKQVILTVLVIAAVFFIYRFWFSNKSNAKEQRNFIKAARKSKRRLKKRHAIGKSPVQSRKKPIRKKSDVQLTVIEGKKGKKKNRAIF